MPLHVRAKGGAFSTAGWSIGNGVVVLLTPYLFNSITYGVFFLFSMLNFACIRTSSRRLFLLKSHP